MCVPFIQLCSLLPGQVGKRLGESGEVPDKRPVIVVETPESTAGNEELWATVTVELPKDSEGLWRTPQQK